MDFLFSLLGFVLAIGILVTVHEFGHFWVARRLGVKVLKFSIGFGRPLVAWRGRDGETEYAIAMIPLGGYVKMLDESEGEVDSGEVHRAFNRKSLSVRSAVVVAGPAFNFLFAILAYWAIFSIGIDGIKPVIGQVAPGSVAERAGLAAGDRVLTIDGRLAHTWGEHRLYMMNRLLDGDSVEFVVERGGAERVSASVAMEGELADALSPAGIEQAIGMAPALPELEAVVGEVVAGSPAAAAGFRSGDRVTAINGNPVDGWRELVEAVMPRPGESLEFTLLRGDERIEVVVVPEPAEFDGRTIGRIGVAPAPAEAGEEFLASVELSPVEGLVRSVENTWLMSVLTLKMLYRMLKLEVSTENLSGPITIAHFAGQSVQIGLVPFLTFLAVISVSLGVLNLLPIPVLDGGHLLYYAIELVRGGPVPERVMYWGQQVGILMLAMLMALAFYNDILRLLG